eukprot:5193021-Pleurochrysis_carterae.AAC.1
MREEKRRGDERREEKREGKREEKRKEKKKARQSRDVNDVNENASDRRRQGREREEARKEDGGREREWESAEEGKGLDGSGGGGEWAQGARLDLGFEYNRKTSMKSRQPSPRALSRVAS